MCSQETEEGIETMCKEMDALCNKREIEVKESTARAMAEDGLSVDRIAHILKVNVSTVEKWISKAATPAC